MVRTPRRTSRNQLKGELFRDLATAYLEMAEKRHRSWREEKRIIDKDLLPVLGFRRLADIRRRDVRELVESIARKREAPIMANRTLGVLSRMFNFALDREWIEANPASRIPEPGEEQSRDRVLSTLKAGRPQRGSTIATHTTKKSATRSNAGRGGYRPSSRARSEKSFRSCAKLRALAENRPLTVSVGSCFPVDRRLPGTFWRAPVRQSAGYDPDREAPIRGASGSR
jgi:hypothetical protein